MNEQDIEDIPEHLRKDLDFIFVDRIEKVLEEALESHNGRRNGRPRSARPHARASPPVTARRRRPARRLAPARAQVRPGPPGRLATWVQARS